jgi:hypothetical protein
VAMYWLVFSWGSAAEVVVVLALATFTIFSIVERNRHFLKIAAAGFIALLVIFSIDHAAGYLPLFSWARIFAQSSVTPWLLFVVCFFCCFRMALPLQGSVTKWLAGATLLLYAAASVARFFKQNMHVQIIVCLIVIGVALVLLLGDSPRQKAVFLSLLCLSFYRIFACDREMTMVFLCASVVFCLLYGGNKYVTDRFLNKAFVGSVISFMMIYCFSRLGNTLSFGNIDISAGFIGVSMHYNVFWVVSILALKAVIPAIIFILAAKVISDRDFGYAPAVALAGFVTAIGVRFSLLQYYTGYEPAFEWDANTTSQLVDQIIFFGIFALTQLAGYGLLGVALKKKTISAF